jgi:hypothetical protein
MSMSSSGNSVRWMMAICLPKVKVNNCSSITKMTVSETKIIKDNK